jgi:fucose 4-O-acetylase-like acetyltransferase|uniref:Acyltransferase n=1 Tax=Paracoccus marcusii TaxID=59779 RepID=R4R2G2_9RHOB|nr:acyltransferase [Paracoccus marcusii]AGL76964.1 acyltransferase [Paracoccus marcusii]
MTLQNRLDHLDFAKGISIALVVVFHATMALDRQNMADAHYWLLNNFMSPIRMPVFFFISGFLMKKSARSASTDAFYRKVAGLIYLFVLWSVIHLLWETVSPLTSAPAANRWVEFLYSPSSVLWFIWALAIYFCIARAGETVRRDAIFVVALMLSLVTYMGLIEFANYAHNNVLKFLPMFLFGAWYAKPLINSDTLRHPATFPLSLLAFGVAFAIIYKGSFTTPVMGTMTFLMAILGIVVGLAMSIFLCSFDLIRRVPVYLGRNTLGIYVAHSPIVAVLAALLAKATQGGMVISMLGVPLVTVAAILLSLGLKIVAERAGGRWFYHFPLALTKNRALSAS